MTLPVDACRVNSSFLITSVAVFPHLCVFRVSVAHLHPGLHQSVLRLLLLSRMGGNTLGFGSSIKAASLLPGRVRTRRQSSGSTGGPSTPVMDSRGRSRAKVVSQSQRMYIDLTSVDTVSLRL